MNIEEITQFEIFNHVENDKIATLLRSHPIKRYYPGDKLITRFEPNQSLFLLLKGSAEVYLNENDDALKIIQAGESFGEISVLDGQSASAHIIALSECETIEINKDEIWELADSSHAFTFNLLKYLVNRLRDFNTQVDKSIQIQHQMERKASVDALTGLYNRRWFDDQFDVILKRCTDNNNAFSFIMIDIDHFKLVNDNYGHATGDIVLHQMGRILKNHARERDAVVRYGGEELAMLLPETNKEQAFAIAERLREKVAESLFTYQKDKTINITISLGCSCYSGSENKQKLMKLADDALYQAKENGRNQVRF